MGNLRATVDVYMNNLRKDNTQKAYEPKVNEYKDYCDHVFWFNDATVRYTVTSETLYRFMFYHVFRDKKPSLGKKRGELSSFDRADYDRVVSRYTSVLCSVESNLSDSVPTDIPDPQNPLGFDQINTYRSAVKGYYEAQCEYHANRNRWEDINTPAVKKLLNIVKGRKKRVKKRTYAEKVEAESSPFHSYGQIGDIERAFWLQGCKPAGTICSRKTFCSLRNRFNLLMNFAAILRNESITLSEFSDCRHFIVQRKEDHDPMLIFLQIIATGKTIKSDAPSQYGRATRHKDVFQCAVGGLGFYLLERFEVNGEFSESNMPDWRNNDEWFDMKLLCEQGKDCTKVMTQRPFMKAVIQVFAELGISANHQAHFGRVTAPVYAEFKELPPEMLKILGNWDRDTQEARYSTKIPLMAIRVMAGFEKGDAYWLPRGRAQPTDELCSMIWPWLEGALASVLPQKDQHPTAVYFLEFLAVLRCVILQDAAAMFVMLRQEPAESRRLHHSLFSLPVFQSAEFLLFTDEMEVILTREATEDPNEATIERAMPGVVRRFDELVTMQRELHGDVSGMVRQQDSKFLAIAKYMEEKEAREVERHKETTATIAGFFRQGADYIEGRADGESVPQAQGCKEQKTQQSALSPTAQALGDSDADVHEEDEVDELVRVSGSQFSFRRKNSKALNLLDMYKEFYGLEEYTGIPIQDGYYGLENKHKNRWRSNYSPADSVFFQGSRAWSPPWHQMLVWRRAKCRTPWCLLQRIGSGYYGGVGLRVW
jgi:hypothetical protein